MKRSGSLTNVVIERTAPLWRGARALTFALALASCGGGGGKPGPTEPVGPTAQQYVNPVLNADFPDPSVMKASDGNYYAYATQTTGIRLQVSHSTNLVTWSPATEAMPTKPSWTSSTSNYFAPDVEQRGSQFVMYYSAQVASGDYCIGMATATSAAGPFTDDSGAPVVCGSGFTTIDPNAFDDPQSGKRYLYWGSGFGPIKVQELNADRRTFVAGSVAANLLFPRNSSDGNYDTSLIEGAWVTYVAPWYYLYFSGNSCCGAGAHYAVMVARSNSPTGPFEVRTVGGASSAANPILHAGGPWLAPGHNSTVKDAAGTEWMVYHAIAASNPYLIPGRTDISRRPMLIDKITYVDGWPTVGVNATPTSTPQTRPATTP